MPSKRVTTAKAAVIKQVQSIKASARPVSVPKAAEASEGSDASSPTLAKRATRVPATRTAIRGKPAVTVDTPAITSVRGELAAVPSGSNTPSAHMANIGKRRATTAKAPVKIGKRGTTAKAAAKTSTNDRTVDEAAESSELSELFESESEFESGSAPALAPATDKGKQTNSHPMKVAAKTSVKRKAPDASVESEESSEPALSPPTKKLKKITTLKAPVTRSTKVNAIDTVTKIKPTRGKPAPKKTTTEAKAANEASAPPLTKTTRKRGPVINQIPTTRLNVYVFGEGAYGELGLGTAKNAVNVRYPRLNPLLLAETVGVVHVATGGMHAAALTHDNKILTWGVNDQGALGRDTGWEGGTRDAGKDDSSSDSEQSESGLNQQEATPTAIPNELSRKGPCTFAVTEDGWVYGWGTFRSNDGILGFTEKIDVQRTPMLIPELKEINQIVAGTNHVLTRTASGKVLAWGSGQQGQLGRRLSQRSIHHKQTLKPHEVALPRNRIVLVGCGEYHSFAVDSDDKTWAWGLNSSGETGHPTGAGEDSAVIWMPTVVESLADIKLKEITGGGHHSVAITADGDALVWGRMDGFQTGITMHTVPASSLIYNDRGLPAILSVPSQIPGLKAIHVAAGTDNSLLITQEGKAYSWGFNANYNAVRVAPMISR